MVIQTQRGSTWVRYFSWCSSKIKHLWLQIKHTQTHTHEHEQAWKDWKQLISGILSSGAKSHLCEWKVHVVLKSVLGCSCGVDTRMSFPSWAGSTRPTLLAICLLFSLPCSLQSMNTCKAAGFWVLTFRRLSWKTTKYGSGFDKWCWWLWWIYQTPTS